MVLEPAVQQGRANLIVGAVGQRVDVLEPAVGEQLLPRQGDERRHIGVFAALGDGLVAVHVHGDFQAAAAVAVVHADDQAMGLDIGDAIVVEVLAHFGEVPPDVVVAADAAAGERGVPAVDQVAVGIVTGVVAVHDIFGLAPPFARELVVVQVVGLPTAEFAGVGLEGGEVDDVGVREADLLGAGVVEHAVAGGIGGHVPSLKVDGLHVRIAVEAVVEVRGAVEVVGGGSPLGGIGAVKRDLGGGVHAGAVDGEQLIGGEVDEHEVANVEVGAIAIRAVYEEAEVARRGPLRLVGHGEGPRDMREAALVGGEPHIGGAEIRKGRLVELPHGKAR